MVTSAFRTARIAGLWHRARLAGPASLVTRLRDRAGGRPAAPAALRPVIVPARLDDLHGPGSGVAELPVYLYWSGSRQFDLADPHQAAALCDAVIDAAATPEALAEYLNADVLIRAWPVLGMSRVKREAWERQFPVLRTRRLAAAA
ncbi:MAG TPA: hypothetical protein VFX25_39720 [Streptosporangiaceae bacterium]|nr:hypothetical protein [Streptosporangiaceae bacterium]